MKEDTAHAQSITHFDTVGMCAFQQAHGNKPPSEERPAVLPLAPAAGGSSASSGKADVSAAAQSATKLVALSLFIDALLLTIVVSEEGG